MCNQMTYDYVVVVDASSMLVMRIIARVNNLPAVAVVRG